MHRGLPLMMSMESVSVSSSESEFGASVSSAMFVGLHAVHSWTSGSRSGLRYLSSSSWMSSYIPSTTDIVSICNVVLEISEVLKYSFPSLNSCFQNSSTMKATISFYTYWVVIYGVKAITI